MHDPTAPEGVHGIKGVLVGFPAGNNYRVYCQSIRRIVTSHDCTFHEDFISYVPVEHHEPLEPALFPELEVKLEAQSSVTDNSDDADSDVPLFPDEDVQEKEDEKDENAFDSDDDDFHDTAMLNTPSSSKSSSQAKSPLQSQRVQLESAVGSEVTVEIPKGDRRNRKSGLRAPDKVS